MICRICNKENEFYQGQSICKECYNQRSKDKYRLRERKEEYPRARCEKCYNLFQLDFDPIREKDKILDKWLCNECKICYNINNEETNNREFEKS